MELAEFLEKISLNSEAKKELLALPLSEQEYENFKEAFLYTRETFFERIVQEKNYRIKLLYLYSRMACEKYPEFCKMGISDEIYYDTFYDLTIWSEDCKEKFKEYGLNKPQWLSIHLDGRLFRLGRLQFEKTTYYCEGKKTPAISIHIPAGEKLDIEKCRNSFQKAEQFFKGDYIYFCHSWLLYPGLKEVLFKSSNIVKFQEFFEIKEVDYDVRQAEQRIFGKEQEDYTKYPQSTGLQKAARNYLLEGKHLGNGFGILKKEVVG